MLFATYKARDNYPIALLVPHIRSEDIAKAYFTDRDELRDQTVVMDLHYSQKSKKTPKAEIKQYVEEMVIPALVEAGSKYVLVADADYFKVLAGTDQAEANLGYAMESPHGDYHVFYVPSYRRLFHDPDKVRAQISTGMAAVESLIEGAYNAPGTEIIKFSAYPNDPVEIREWLNKLLAYPKLAFDIEGQSLKHYDCGIATVTVCWDKHEGIAFPVDFGPEGHVVRDLLVEFFENYTGKMIWHNICFDVYVLVYQLFMRNLTDTEGLLHGLKVLLRDWDCTKLITYLATNSCAGNKLGLKYQAQEFAGNYAVEEIKDVTLIPLDELLQYNLIDGLSTLYVHEKWWDKLVNDDQLEVYESVFKPAVADIIQMQLTGMPVDMVRVKEVKAELETIQQTALDTLLGTKAVQQFEYMMKEDWVVWKNSTLKKKVVSISDAGKIVFNPNSNPQLQKLLYNQLSLPVIELTDSKQPATDGDTLKKLLEHTTDTTTVDVLKALMDFSVVNKVLSSFIPAMENAQRGPDGWYYLFGNFNLGGTLSGRLSSSNPNLQNLPAGGEGEKTLKGRIGKLIKSCFKAPPGWLFGGLDFASLEDRISALTTKDPNKLKVYTDGYDGHSLRAFFYFREQMPDIEDNVISINSIQDKYKPQRQDSKAPTFALTYQGTWITLVNNCGFSAEKAKLIESRYHEMYEVSDKWVADQLNQACKDGYVTAAFGLRVRTPLLAQTVLGTKSTPYEAAAEGRSAGNALGQSWCLLNSRAGSEFMGKVRQSQYRLDIKPCAQIHDASYYLIRDNINAVRYCNIHLVKAVQWQEHPLIQHDQVKLGGELSIFYPSWEKEVVIPNNASDETILSIIDKHVAKLAA